MFKILQQPYPFSEKSTNQIVIQSIFEGLFVAFFLIVIQPFGIGNSNFENKYLYLFLYGLVTTICVLFLRILILKKFSKYSAQSNWKVLNEIISVLSIIALITIGNYLLTIFLFGIKNSFYGFFSMLFMVITIGIFPTIFGVLTNYNYQFKKYNKTIEIEPTISKHIFASPSLKIKLTAENERDFFEIEPENLLFIESTDNYATIYFLQNNILQKELIRSSLTRLESQIKSNKILRCHRSFIVNLDQAKKITGNAQGYKLQLNFSDLMVPIARKYSYLVDNLK